MKLIEIWRYPVKSMRGEQLDEAMVGPAGVAGDRHWAVVDAETGVSLSAKRYGALLHCRARTGADGVMIGLPDGREMPAGSDEVASGLSDLLGRRVVTRSAGAAGTIRHEFPTAVTEGEGDPFLWEPGTEAFFDSAPLHLLTTATLAELRRLLPDSKIDQTRFRPNFVVASGGIGFIENEWVNRTVTLGALACLVTDPTKRCVMVTRDQGDLPRDPEVVRRIYKANDGNAGVAMRALDSGHLQCGAEVRVEE
jgi:uncharacterized protein YcbX